MRKTKKKIKFILISQENQDAVIKKTTRKSEQLSERIKKLTDKANNDNTTVDDISSLKKKFIHETQKIDMFIKLKNQKKRVIAIKKSGIIWILIWKNF